MDNLLNRMEYDFESGFSELTDEKDTDLVKPEITSPSKNVDSSSLKDNVRIGILPDIENFGLTDDSLTEHRKFSDSDFKYLLSKSPADGEQKKTGKSKKETEEEEREKMQVLVSNFTEEQLDRYEMYRRAAFPKASIKRIMQMITGNSVSQNAVIAMSGIAKVFIGEIVEEALDIMELQNDIGPLQPKHLREAVRRLREKGKIPGLRDKKPNYRF